MQTIKVKLIEDVTSLVTVVKDNDTVVLPVVVELDLANAVSSFQAKYPGVKDFYFTTDTVSQVKSIKLQHSTVTGDDVDSAIVISDRMYDDEKPTADIITYLEALATL